MRAPPSEGYKLDLSLDCTRRLLSLLLSSATNWSELNVAEELMALLGFLK